MSERTSKYDALGAVLAEAENDELRLSLVDIAQLVGPLPDEATRPQFWANVVDHHDARRRQWLNNGFRAYFDRSGPAVQFVRDIGGDSDNDHSDEPWSDAELRTCVLSYRQLWEAESRGQKLNKSAIRREAFASGMSGRSKGSYEFRMQNISALLDELGLPFVRGYLPRRNVGGQKARMVSLINDAWQRNEIAEAPTENSEALATRVMAALEKIQVNPHSPPLGTTVVARSPSTALRFLRDPAVIAWVLLRADGQCEACGEPAPFRRADGTPFLEVHHLRALADGGPDVVTNALASCPNCHRRLHHGFDRKKFRRSVLKRIPVLVDYPKRLLDVVELT